MTGRRLPSGGTARLKVVGAPRCDQPAEPSRVVNLGSLLERAKNSRDRIRRDSHTVVDDFDDKFSVEALGKSGNPRAASTLVDSLRINDISLRVLLAQNLTRG